MDGARFDALVRLMASPAHRRPVLRGLAATMAAVVGASAMPRVVRGVCGADYNSLSCDPGEDCCNGICYDLSRTDLHCGVCGHQCPVGSRCTGGACRYADGTITGSSSTEPGLPGPGRYDSATHGFSLVWDESWSCLDGWSVDWSASAWQWLALPTAPQGVPLDDHFYLMEQPSTLGQLAVFGITASSDPIAAIEAELNIVGAAPNVTNLSFMQNAEGQTLEGGRDGYHWLIYSYLLQTSQLFDPQPVIRYTQVGSLPGQSLLVLQWTQGWSGEYGSLDHVDALVQTGLYLPSQ